MPRILKLRGSSSFFDTRYVLKAGDTMTGALTNTLASGNSLVWDTSTLIVDATNHRVGIGTTAPTGILELQTSAANLDLYTTSYAGTIGWTARRANGTLGSPSATSADNIIMSFNAQGYANGAFTATRGQINIKAAENWTSSAQGTYMTFETAVAGGLSRTEKMRIHTNGFVGIGTAGPLQKLNLSNGYFRFDYTTKPGAPTVALAGLGAGNLTNGAYTYQVTYVTALGETEAGTTSGTVTVVDATTNGQVALSAIPVSSSSDVTSRKIYRTISGGTAYKLLTTIADNTTTTFTDNVADGSLGATAPTINTTSGKILAGGATMIQLDSANGNMGLVGTTPTNTLGIFASKTFSIDQGAILQMNAFHNTATAGTVYGFIINSSAIHSTGTMNTIQCATFQAIYGGAAASGATAAVTAMYGFFSRITANGSNTKGTIANAYAVYIDSPSNQMSGSPDVTITNLRGFHIQNQGLNSGTNGLVQTSVAGLMIATQTGATNNSGLVMGNGTTIPSGNWAIYNASTNNNYFAGIIGIGVTAPTALLHLKAGTASANTAPLKFNSGTNLTSAEVGAMEYNGNFYLSNVALRFPVGGTLFDHFADAGNTHTDGVTYDTLYTDTIAANTFNGNGDKVIADYSGTFVASGTATREIQVLFAGTVILDTGALTTSTAEAWDIDIVLIRVSSSIVRCMAKIVSSTSLGAGLFGDITYTAITSLTLSATNVLKIQAVAGGVGAAANDIVGKLGTVAFMPAA